MGNLHDQAMHLLSVIFMKRFSFKRKSENYHVRSVFYLGRKRLRFFPICGSDDRCDLQRHAVLQKVFPVDRTVFHKKIPGSEEES